MNDTHHGTLVALTVAEVTLDGDYRHIVVMNRSGTAEIYFTVDGPDPTVEGADCEVLPAVICSAEVLSRASGSTVVRLISDGTPSYSVIGEIK